MKILFAFAHPDDEAFGPCCTIRKLVDEGHDVIVASMCNGARPGAEHVAEARGKAFKKSCKMLGVKGIIHNNSDLTLGYGGVVNYAVSLIGDIQPDIVYTNNISDINADHRMLAEACMVACRPKPGSSVKELYFCEIPGSTDWTFHQIQPAFEPNVFVDISDTIDDKEKMVKLYGTEMYAYPDARSFEATMIRAANHGINIGVKAAEAFKLVFSVK